MRAEENYTDEPILMEEINIDSLEMPVAPDLEIPDLEIPDLDLADLGMSDIEMPGEEAGMEDLEIPDLEMPNLEIPAMQVSDTGEEISLEDLEMSGSEDELNLEDIGLPEVSLEEPFQDGELSIDGLDQAIQSETELQMAGELNIDDLALLDDGDSESDISISMDDNLEDVLNMLDDDAELAEINDMLKKSDNNEPIQDDMMELLHQMADDEAASVNAGTNRMDDDDDGVPIPELPQSMASDVQTEAEAEKDSKKKSKGKAKKVAAKKKKGDGGDSAVEAKGKKELGKLGKFFNFLTEEFEPEPTEEELAAEKEAKEAKKQENLSKKEEEKLAKAEAKKAKADEKAAANKAKKDAAAQKKKEKQAKAEAKKAKLAAERPKKKIPPKKIAVVAVFGVSVGSAVILASNILSTQGFLQTARNAFYDGDYKTVYATMYGMELDDSGSDGLIKEKSKVIFMVQRRYDSYQINMKMGREVEALDALLCGLTAYDVANADAEKYGVMSDIDAIKADILEILDSKYGLDETAARALIGNDDPLSYTIALNEIIAAN